MARWRLGESITPWMLLCGAVIVLGTALATGFLKFGGQKLKAAKSGA
jgi:hypothetical protein